MLRPTFFISIWKNAVTLKTEHDNFMSWSYSKRTGSLLNNVCNVCSGGMDFLVLYGH